MSDLHHGPAGRLNAKNTAKPLYIKKIRYVAIRKLVERPDPLHIITSEAYQPYKEPDASFKDSLRRIAHRAKSIPILTPATHELHLAAATVTDSIQAIGDYNMPIAAMFNLYGSTRGIIGRRSGCSGYLIEHNDHEWAYFILTWKDVLAPPDYTPGPGKSKQLRDRLRYPTDTLGRTEDGSKVYYVQKANPQEYAAIVEALKSVREKPSG